MPIQIPANLTGSLQLTVADAARTGADDRRDTRGADLQRVSQLIRTFNRARRNNRLYVRLTSSDSGAVVNGEPMAGLPPSVLAVIEADRNSGTVGSLRSDDARRMGAGARRRRHRLAPVDPFPRSTLMIRRNLCRRGARPSACSRVSHALGRARLLAGRDAGRFPARRCRSTVDRRARPPDARARADARSRRRRAVRVDRARRRPTARWFLGTGNDGKVIRVDRSGQGSVFYDSTEMEVHALAAAPGGGLYVGTSPDGRIYKRRRQGTGHDVLRSRRQVHLVAGRRSRRQRVRRHRRQGHGLQDHARRQGREVLRDQDHARRVAGVRCRTASCWSAPARPAASSASTRAGKGFLLLDTTYQEIHAIRVDPKGVIYAAAQSGRAPGRRVDHDSPMRRRPRR